MNIAAVNLTGHKLDLVQARKLIKIVLAGQHDLTGISIAFVSQREIRRLNRVFRNINAATDVLSFRAGADDGLAEIALCPAVIERDAMDLGMSFQQLLRVELVHGLAHIVGLDHRSTKQARLMEKWEKEAHRRLADFFTDNG